MGELEIIALVVLGPGLCYAWRSFRRARTLADNATARIRSAPQGYVELNGRAELMDGDLVIAPLSGLACCWYRYRIERKTSDGKWKTVDKGMSDALFWLTDETGRCALDPDGAEVIKTGRDIWYGDGAPCKLAGMEHELPQWLEGLRGFGADYRYTEQRILPGEEIHVLGLFCTVGGISEAPHTRRELYQLLEDWKKDSRRMALFDRNGDGHIDAEEWEAVRRAAHHQIQRAQLARSVNPDVHMLRNPGDRNRPFLISAVSEYHLVRRFQRHAAISLLAALLAGGYLAWVFV